MSGSKQTVSIAELEAVVVRAAQAAPETADVVRVRIGLRPGGTADRRASHPGPPRTWFVDSFERAHVSGADIGDAAVAAALAEIAENLAHSYEPAA